MHKTNIVCIFFTLEGYHRMLIVFNFCKSYYIAGDKYLLFPSLLLVKEYTLQNFSIYYFSIISKVWNIYQISCMCSDLFAQTVHDCTDDVCLSCAFHFRYYISSLRLWSSKSIAWLHVMYASYILFRNNFFCKFK